MDTLPLRVTKIKPAANEAILVTLERDDNQAVSYQAGQFLTFIIDFHGKELRRSYSISSTPGVDKDLTILIKRIENGAVSRYLIDHLQAGEVLQALPPSGRFTLLTDSSNRRTLFFLAAGSGISPIYGLLKKLLMEEPFSRALLIYQNHDEASIIFKEELEALLDKFENRFVMINLLSNPIYKDHVPQRLNNYLLEKLLSTYLNINSPHDFYMCGPASFMRMIQFVLKVMGVSDDHIRKENFVVDVIPPALLLPDTSSKEIILRWKNKVFEFSVSYPDTILQAALRSNIPLPYSCRAGRCGSCTLVCVSGDVKMSINEVLTNRDLKEGLVLTCVGYAETDLVLEL